MNTPLNIHILLGILVWIVIWKISVNFWSLSNVLAWRGVLLYAAVIVSINVIASWMFSDVRYIEIHEQFTISPPLQWYGSVRHRSSIPSTTISTLLNNTTSHFINIITRHQSNESDGIPYFSFFSKEYSHIQPISVEYIE